MKSAFIENFLNIFYFLTSFSSSSLENFTSLLLRLPLKTLSKSFIILREFLAENLLDKVSLFSEALF